MKKIGIGFAAAMFVGVMTIFACSFAFADAHVQSSGILYDGGFMNEILTRRNPSPWNVVRHYVGNKPALIVKILKEQNISLNPVMKYPVGTAIKIPQKYVLKSLLPTPSQAEVAIKDAEHQAGLQKQTNEFFAALKSKEMALATSYGFIVLLVLALFAAVMAGRSWHNKFIGAEATASAKEKELEKNKDYHRQYAASAKRNEFELGSQVVVLQKRYDELLPRTPGNYRSVREQSGKEHICLVVSACLMTDKSTQVSIACPYCPQEKVAVCQSDEGMIGHIARNHPEQMNPNPKAKKMGFGVRIEN